MAIEEANAFIPFPKISRFSRDIIITEKIDGTNAQIYIGEDGEVRAGSRTRWIFPGNQDNYGFASWVAAHREELVVGLGPGRHFGEWWGSGIQRTYGMREKHFSLFNVSRWGEKRPACCDVVPTIFTGPFLTDAIAYALDTLITKGSLAAPGYRKPEGIIIFHTASGHLYKKTIEKDESPKTLCQTQQS